ncbi:kelch domain-containing protein 7A [Dendropsophus ebraccatus]|uniref:kelch domain-containing protein 7A n=1 Tax=Dendropsophus ebraccatus TaxID=150705 RepID=UPI003831A8E1
MINTVWESTLGQSDMQLIGKVALSATAVFILALAYRFYKLRKLESTEPTGKHDLGCGTEKSTATVETPLRDYIGDETGNLRFRCVHKNLQNSSVTDLGNKNFAAERVTLHQAQEGLQSDEVTCKDQSGLKSEDAEQWLRKDDPLQSQRQLKEGTDGQTDQCKETIHKTQTQDCRQDPEGGEMQEKSLLANGSTGQDSKDLPPRHRNQAEEKCHQVIATQMQEDIITNGGPIQTLTVGGLPEKMVESSSLSVTDEADLHFDTGVHGAQTPLMDLPPSTEREDVDINAQQEPSGNDGIKGKTQEEIGESQGQNVMKDHREKESKEENTATQGIQSTIVSSVNASPSLSKQQDQDGAGVVQSGPNSYRIADHEEASLDVHLSLENCYDILCLAKKNNHDGLIAAAYKTMSDDYLHILQNPTIYGRLNATERDLILEGRMKGRRFVVVADIDTQATSASENKSNLSYYDTDNDQWHGLSHIPNEAVSRGCSMATLFNYLFIVLGSDGLDRQMKPSKRVICYNPLTDSWKEVAPLKEARPHCKLVALDGCLYAIGGECLHTVEKYDPRLNRWSYIAPLPNDTFAVAHMATACDEEIYVTGGTIRYMLLRYNLREKIWKNSLISGSKDRTTEIIAANNFLYRFDLNRNMGISVHRCNIRARIWYECATYAMPYPSPFQCVVIDNSIYCISRNFHLRLLADEVSPRFMEVDLQTVPSPKGILYPLVLVLPVKGIP